MMPSSRFWRCSRPGRLTYRSTPPIPTLASSSCSPTPHRSPPSPPPRCAPRCVGETASQPTTTTAVRPRLDGYAVVVVDTTDPHIHTYPDTGLPAPAADDLAHIIYTSGT